MCQCSCKPESSFRNNGNQMEFPGFETRFKDKYLDGYECGVNWDANWMPGGPWVYSGPNVEMRKNSSIGAEQWLTGFSEGLAMRLKTNAHFAAWWNRNKGKNINSATIGEVRYTAPEGN